MKVVIPTCDKYAHTVPPHVHLLRKLWPDCPYEIVVVTTEKPIDVDVEVIRLGKDRGYCDNLHRFLNLYYQEELMMLCLEDLLPMRINTGRIQQAMDVLSSDESVNMIRLTKRFTRPGKPYRNSSLFVEMAKTGGYLFSQKGTIWRTRVFSKMLPVHCSPWRAEYRGDAIGKRMQGAFLGVAQPVLVQRNWIVHGRQDKATTRWVEHRMENRKEYGKPKRA